MKERPILFSGPMVCAILAGQKTVTRRVLKPQPVRSLPHTETIEQEGHDPLDIHHPLGWRWKTGFAADEGGGVSALADRWTCPFGNVGDRLWVRETWRTDELATTHVDGIRFRADDAFVEIANTREAADLWVDAHDNGKHGTDWRPSIFMRPWMCRLKLEVTGVTVERLQSITNEQAVAEGTPCWICGRTIDGLSENDCACFHNNEARDSFEALWESINGERPGCAWKDNPWVWSVSFKPVEDTK